MHTCPHCQTTHPTHQLTCRRCGKYLTDQGQVEYVGNPMIVMLVVGALLFVLGFGAWFYMKSLQNKPTRNAEASATPLQTAQKPAESQPAGQTKAKKTRKKRRK